MRHAGRRDLLFPFPRRQRRLRAAHQEIELCLAPEQPIDARQSKNLPVKNFHRFDQENPFRGFFVKI
jgi:hypothetical protein